MAKRGETKTQKRISVSKTRKLMKKEYAWTFRAIPGPHTAESSVPLGFVVRDLLAFARNAKEARFLLNNNVVLVNGVRRTDVRFPVGIFDVVDFETTKKRYRVFLDRKGVVTLREIPVGGKLAKLCKLSGKKSAGKGKFQYVFNDGTVLLNEKDSMKIGDSAKIEFPGKRIAEVYPLQKGSVAYVVGGLHIGQTAKVTDIIEGTISREKLVNLKSEKASFQTVARNVFVIGEKKSEIELLGDRE